MRSFLAATFSFSSAPLSCSGCPTHVFRCPRHFEDRDLVVSLRKAPGGHADGAPWPGLVQDLGTRCAALSAALKGCPVYLGGSCSDSIKWDIARELAKGLGSVSLCYRRGSIQYGVVQHLTVLYSAVSRQPYRGETGLRWGKTPACSARECLQSVSEEFPHLRTPKCPGGVGSQEFVQRILWGEMLRGTNESIR